jgi:hypothetical protein
MGLQFSAVATSALKYEHLALDQNIRMSEKIYSNKFQNKWTVHMHYSQDQL